MSMTRSEFNMAFSTVIAEEFADIPDESEIEVEFSDEFNRKMQELIDSIGANDGQKPKSSHNSVRGRRRGRNRPRLCVHGSARRVYGNGTGAE